MDENNSTQMDAEKTVVGSKKVKRALFPVLDRKFQTRVTLLFLVIFLLSYLFLFVIQYKNLSNTATGVLGKSGTQVEVYLRGQRKAWTRDLMLGILIIGSAIGICVFYLTQKVVGPLFAMSRILEDVADGDYGARVHLRTSDELHWFADKINEMIAAIESRHK